MLEIDLQPPATEVERTAVAAGLSAADIDLVPGQQPYRSAWRLAGLVEALDREPRFPAGYAPSPRSSLGAARA